MLLWLVVLILLSLALIVAGLRSMQGESTPRRSNRGPVAISPELAPAPSRRLTPLDLGWRRPYWAPMALTGWNAALFMVISPMGMGTVLMFLGLAGGLNPTAWPRNLPWVVAFTLVLSAQALLLIYGVREWQRVKALEARGQVTQGVILDRWVRRGRGSAYCVAYYFELPWGSAPVVRAEINDEAYRAYQVGDAVQVRYLPDKPQVCPLEV